MSPLARKCTLTPSKHSNHIPFNCNVHLHPQIIQINPSTSQICFCTFKSLKLRPLQLQCVFAPSNHSNRAFFNSNMPLHPSTTQLMSPLNSNDLQYNTQMCTIALNCIFLSSNFQVLNDALNVH